MSLPSFNGKRFAALLRMDYGERRMSYCFFLLGAYLISAIALTAGSMEVYRNTLPAIDVFYQRGAFQPGADPGWNVGKQYLTALCWYATYRRLARRDLEYCPPSPSSAA